MDSDQRIAHFLTQFIPPDPNSIAANIPLDIFIDDISPYLQVEDILALRRVNKHYFHLTHEPIIWKRFLKELRITLPPIRPTLKYSARSTDYEIEQLVTRAISMEDNWRRRRPTVASTMVFDASLEVFDMKLLPGGKYLVVSIGDDHRFVIALYHLDHPSGRHVLASFRIPTKAYQLQAKYMTYKGKPVIMIASIRQLSDEDRRNIDLFAHNAPIVSAFDLHILHCMHVDLNALDLLAGAPRDPAGSETINLERYEPFMETAKLLLTTPPTQLSLYSQEGVAHASVIQDGIVAEGQDYLVIINLEHPRQKCILVCQPYVYPHNPYRPVRLLPNMKQWIKAIRHLPEQNDVLIWRTIRTTEPDADDERHAHSIEVLTIPPHSHEKKSIFSVTPFWGHLVLPDGKVQSVHMTDDLWPYDGQSDFPLQASSQPPPPISVFAEMSRPQGILHWHIWPIDGQDSKNPPYSYYPYLNTVVKQTMHNAKPYIGHVLPGVFHSLIYTTEETDSTGTPLSLVALRRYISPEYQANAYPLARVEHHSTVERHKYQPMPLYVYATIDIGQEALARYRLHGLGAVAWDHTIGRLCLTTGRGSVIEVIDFSHATPPDDRFHNPKMTSPGDFEHRNEDQEATQE